MLVLPSEGEKAGRRPADSRDPIKGIIKRYDDVRTVDKVSRAIDKTETIKKKAKQSIDSLLIMDEKLSVS